MDAIDFSGVFSAAPSPYLLLAAEPDFPIVAVNDAYLAATLTTRARLVGQRLFDAFPDNPADPAPTGARNLRASLEEVLRTRAAHTMALQKYDIRTPEGVFEERYWALINSPVLAPDGRLTHLIHHVQDVTDFVRLKRSNLALGAVNDQLRDEAERRSEEISRTAVRERLTDRKLRESEIQLLASNSRLAEYEQRLATEVALRASEERFGAFVRAVSEVVYRISPDWQEMRQLAGHEFMDTAQRTRDWLGKYIHPADQPEVLRAVNDAVRTRSMLELEHRVLRVDGSTAWVMSRAVPLFNASGEVEEWLGAANDISERRQGEQLLLAQNTALELLATGRSLTEVLQSLVRIVEEQSQQRVVACILLLDENTGKLHTAAAPSLPPDFSAAIDSIEVTSGVGTFADSAARNQVVRTLDIASAASWQGHSQLPLSLGLKAAWSMPIRGSEGGVLGIFGTYFREARAPTEREQRIIEGLSRLAAVAIARLEADQEREELLRSEQTARADAERSSRMKDEFLATLSHELRTPLNAVLGWAQILMRSRPSMQTEQLPAGLAAIERNARAQARIIDDLLDMSRIISGKVRLEVQRVDLAPMVTAAIDTVRPAADAKGVRLQSVLDPLAGAVSGDPSRLQQILWNLISNAVKFTPRAGRVQVVLERVDSHLEIAVMDTGSGIAPQFLPFVFDRFRQADGSATRPHVGLGLGLAIVKQLVELHGGSVRAKSPGEGQGSTFTVALPMPPLREWTDVDGRRQPHSAAVEPEPLESDPARGFTNLAGTRVLVVDDEPDSRAVVRQLLEGCHAIVLEAGSAAEALDLFREQAPDVLVSDIGMPQESGYSLIRKVRALPVRQGGDTPAVALTAYARSEDRMQAVMAGFQHHVAKPVEAAELIAMIASLVKRARRLN